MYYFWKSVSRSCIGLDPIWIDCFLKARGIKKFPLTINSKRNIDWVASGDFSIWMIFWYLFLFCFQTKEFSTPLPFSLDRSCATEWPLPNWEMIDRNVRIASGVRIVERRWENGQGGNSWSAKLEKKRARLSTPRPSGQRWSAKATCWRPPRTALHTALGTALGRRPTFSQDPARIFSWPELPPSVFTEFF